MKPLPMFSIKVFTSLLHYPSSIQARWKRGLLKEKVCIPCGINLNGLSIARISNLGKPKWTDIEKVLGGLVEHDSVFVTDSFRGYQRLS